MAINLCAEELATNGLISIECSQISSDRHSVTNLYSTDPELSRLGFRTELFIRPPIELIFRSKFKFDLSRLEMGLRLGDNKTDSFEVVSDTDWQTNQTITKQFNLHSNDSICITNVCFRPNGTLGSTPMNIENHSSPSLVVKCFKNCFKINSIKVKIFKTSNSSIPCLSYLKIFGQPNRKTSKQVLDTICDIYSKKTTKIVGKTFNFYNSGEPSSELNFSDNRVKRKSDSNDTLVDNQLSIPEDFIDLITNEVMIDPILLPSGHSVDKTTLDKYLMEESKWCRPPSDPFTQLVFTSERQPKPNYILRQRIDTFLSQTCSQSIDERLETSKKRRIVGSGFVNPENLLSSRLLSSNSVTEKDIKPIESNFVTKTNQICVECRRSHQINDYSILYKLICNHIICRQKLTEKLDKNLKSISCNECKRETPSDRIIKLNRI